MSMRVLVVFLFALVLVAPATASERHPTLAELEHEVMCPTCHTLLELSHAPIADRMRAFIRGRIAAGDTKSEIKNELVAEFGQGILAVPPAHGFGLLAWALPVFGLLAAAAVVGVIARQWTRAEDAEIGPVQAVGNGRAQLDPAQERQLDEALVRFDD